jgi:hypothetical protein
MAKNAQVDFDSDESTINDESSLEQALKREVPTSNIDNVDQNREGAAGFVVPRDFVMLPSKGVIYPIDSPLHGLEEIEVRHLTAQDEDVLTSRSLLRSGKALDAVLNNVILNKSVKADKMISGDKNAILTFLRITGYGPEYLVQIDCPSCGADVKHEFDLSTLSMRFLDVPPIADGENKFEYTLPSGTQIHFKFLTTEEENAINEQLEKAKKMTNSPFDSNVTTRLKHQLVAINGDDSPSTINQFVDVMSVRDSRAFRKYFDEIEPDVIMKQDFNCAHCGHRGEVEIPITVGFFWPDSES